MTIAHVDVRCTMALTCGVRYLRGPFLEYTERKVYRIPVILNYSVWSSLNANGMEEIPMWEGKRWYTRANSSCTHTIARSWGSTAVMLARAVWLSERESGEADIFLSWLHLLCAFFFFPQFWLLFSSSSLENATASGNTSLFCNSINDSSSCNTTDVQISWQKQPHWGEQHRYILNPEEPSPAASSCAGSTLHRYHWFDFGFKKQIGTILIVTRGLRSSFW